MQLHLGSKNEALEHAYSTFNFNSKDNMKLSPLPIRRDYHVTFDKTSMFWKVKQEYRADTFRYTISKTEAVGAAIEAARMLGVSVIVHGLDGRIQYVNSYDDWVGPRDALTAISSQ